MAYVVMSTPALLPPAGDLDGGSAIEVEFVSMICLVIAAFALSRLFVFCLHHDAARPFFRLGNILDSPPPPLPRPRSSGAVLILLARRSIRERKGET